MFNVHVNIGVNEETGEYVLLIVSGESRTQVQMDVTEMVTSLLEHEIARRVSEGRLLDGRVEGSVGVAGVDGVSVWGSEGVSGEGLGESSEESLSGVELGRARSGGIYSESVIGFRLVEGSD